MNYVGALPLQIQQAIGGERDSSVKGTLLEGDGSGEAQLSSAEELF